MRDIICGNIGRYGRALPARRPEREAEYPKFIIMSASFYKRAAMRVVQADEIIFVIKIKIISCEATSQLRYREPYSAARLAPRILKCLYHGVTSIVMYVNNLWPAHREKPYNWQPKRIARNVWPDASRS